MSLKIAPFSHKYLGGLMDICRIREKSYGLDAEISKRTLSSKKMSGLAAVDEGGVLHGFIGFFSTTHYAYLLMKRLPASPYYHDLLPKLFSSIYPLITNAEYSTIRASYPINGPYFPFRPTSGEWKILDEFLIVENLSYPPTVTNNIHLSSPHPKEKGEISNFISNHMTGGRSYDSMIPLGGVWLPASSEELFSPSEWFKIYTARSGVELTAVALVSLDLRDEITEISRIWGDPDAILPAIINKCRGNIRWYIHPSEKEKARRLGFSPSLKFQIGEERLYESHYALLEKRLTGRQKSL